MKKLTHKFVSFIPKEIEENVIYISIDYCTAIHKCCCGCGEEVVTPISPVNWQILFDGDTISLEPSIGNWDFPCKSHYWIIRNQVKFSRKWNYREIEKVRKSDSYLREKYFPNKKMD